MLSYWDLSEPERALLQRENVESFIDTELMLKGVLRAPTLELLPETFEPRTECFYGFRAPGRYGHDRVNVVFETETQALEFLRQKPLFVVDQYVNSETILTVSGEGFEHEQVRCIPVETFSAVRSDIDKCTAAKQENKRRREEYEKATKAQSEALEGMWQDWFRCVSLDGKMHHIVAVFMDYKKTCDGDDLLATKFLQKVYPAEEIIAASGWCKVVIPIELADERKHEDGIGGTA